ASNRRQSAAWKRRERSSVRRSALGSTEGRPRSREIAAAATTPAARAAWAPAYRPRQLGGRGKAVAQGDDVGVAREVAGIDAEHFLDARETIDLPPPVQDLAQAPGEPQAVQ